MNHITNYKIGVESTVLNLEHSFVAPLFYEESGHDRVYSRDNKYVHSNFKPYFYREMAGVFIKGHGSNSSIIQKLLVGEIDRIPFPSLLAAAEIDSLDTPTQIFGMLEPLLSVVSFCFLRISHFIFK